MKHIKLPKSIVFLLATACLFVLGHLPRTAAAEAAGEYIVRLEDGVSPESAGLELEALFAPEGLYKTGNAEAVEALERAGALVYAEPDYTVTLEDLPDDLPLGREMRWYLSLLGADYCRERDITGQGVRVGVVDSGLYAAHEALAGARIIPGVNYCVPEGNPLRGDTGDSVGHGTFVSGVIAGAGGGLAPDVELVPLKCFDAKTGAISGIVAAIFDAVDTYHCQVLNFSFGITSNSTALREAIAYAEAAGVVMTAASGNMSSGRNSTGNDPYYYPAAYSAVVSVGATDREKTVASFSVQNGSVWVSAPGKTLFGLSPAGVSSYVTNSGTSFSAPAVAAAAALVLSVRPDLTSTEIVALLRETAEDLGTPGYDPAYGWGMLRLDTLLATACGDADYLTLDYLRQRAAESLRPLLALLAFYDARGAMLSVTPVEPGDAGLPSQPGAAERKLFLLDAETFQPLYAVYKG